MRRGGFAPGLLALAMAAACGHAPPREEPQSPRAAADLDAAPSPEAGIEPQPWVSPRAYRHYLAALLARDRDDHGSSGPVCALRIGCCGLAAIAPPVGASRGVQIAAGAVGRGSVQRRGSAGA